MSVRKFLRQFKLHDESDSDLVVPRKTQKTKAKESKLGGSVFGRPKTINKGDAGPSSAMYEVESIHPAPVAPRVPLAAQRDAGNTSTGARSFDHGREPTSEEDESRLTDGHSVAAPEHPDRQDDIPATLHEQTVTSNAPPAGLNVYPIALSTTSNILSQPQPTLDASVHISNQGVTYNIGGSAVVQLMYGSQINQQRGRRPMDAAIIALTRSYNAEYDMTASTTRGPCTPQTRTAILQKLGDWCNAAGVVLYWLNGMAGTGKTTIAYSLCEILATANLLSASFFCSRSLPDCRDINIIIPTIAFQLAQRYPPFADSLAEALQKDEGILKRGMDVQLRKLIIEPWNAKNEQLPPHTVVVLDALDECDERHSSFLQIIIDHVTMLPFKFMITSRPEPSIREVMIHKAEVLGTLHTFILHEVEDDLVQEDIAKYLSSQLSPHVGPDDIQFLTDLAGTLFIFAATLARFLTAKNINLAMRIKLLRASLPQHAKLKMLELLDELYKGVLRAAFHDGLMEEEKQEIEEMLFTVVCAREPLTKEAIASLWKVTEKEVENRFNALRSVVFFPPGHHQPLRTFHASFQDFLLDPTRSGEFCCQILSFNSKLFWCCFALIKEGLHQNICHLEGRPPNDAIDSDVIRTHIPPSLRYASIYWLEHWTLSDHSTRYTTLGLLSDFFTTGALHWFECLSLIGKLAITIGSLEKLQDMLTEKANLADIAHDYLRFVQHAYEIIEHSAMESYFSALTWIPLQSLIRTTHSSLCETTPQVLCGLPITWTGPDQAITIHSGTIYSVVASRDGCYIVSGSVDRTVRIWNVRSHVEECALDGHADVIRSVAISGKGNRVVSGSDDGIVRVWDITAQETILALKSDSSVSTVAISPNDERIASGHQDNFIRVWCAADGHLIHSLQGHTDSVRSVSFTADGRLLVTGSNDNTARIWNMMTGNVIYTLYGHTDSVTAVACSPNGDNTLTGSEDMTTRLWNMSGKELCILRGHQDSISCVAFMPNGKQVVAGSYDKTLRVWDITSGDVIYVLIGLADVVHSVAVLPDGPKIASSSGETISIWSLRGGDTIDGEQQGDDTKSVAFSADGRKVLLLPSLRILDTATLEEKVVLGSGNVDLIHGALSTLGNRVAASQSRTIKVWELTGGDVVANHFTLDGHIDQIKSVSFSHDARQLVSAAGDSTARVWDTATGTQIHALNHRPGSEVQSAAHSHDDTQIVSNARPMVHVWNAQSGEQLYQFDADARSVAFSSDDRHIIATSWMIVSVYNAITSQLEHTYKGYKCWTMMNDGSSYALSDDDRWICRSSRPGDQPHRLLWIPSQYRHYISDYRLHISGPLFTSTSSGVQVCLPRERDLVTLVIPRDT